jgi:hypothetical protein
LRGWVSSGENARRKARRSQVPNRKNCENCVVEKGGGSSPRSFFWGHSVLLEGVCPLWGLFERDVRAILHSSIVVP